MLLFIEKLLPFSHRHQLVLDVQHLPSCPDLLVLQQFQDHLVHLPDPTNRSIEIMIHITTPRTYRQSSFSFFSTLPWRSLSSLSYDTIILLYLFIAHYLQFSPSLPFLQQTLPHLLVPQALGFPEVLWVQLYQDCPVKVPFKLHINTI